MAKYQKYAEYKDSGVEWLGEIPAKWKVLRYKNILKIMQGMAFKSSEYVDSSSVINIRMGNIKKGGSIDLNHNTKYLPENYKSIYRDYELRKGDTIIAMTDMSPTLDFLAVPAILDFLDANSTYLLNQRVGKLILNRDYEIRFVRYLLLSENLRIQLKAKGLGTVQANMSNDDLYSSYLFCPPLVERLNIANFLDHETAKIDHLIEKQQQLIELLKEKRQAVISHAVTKGLDPNVPMKDSGVEWLGEVPEHWEIIKFDYVINSVGDIDHYMPNSVDSGIPYVMTGDLQDLVSKIDFESCKQVAYNDYIKLSRKIKTSKDDIILARYATIGTISYVDIDAEFLVSYSCVTIKPNIKRTSGRYLFCYLKSQAFLQAIKMHINSNTQGNVGVDSLRNVKIVVPPLSEQNEIIHFLNEEVVKVDKLINKAESAISLMQERRTALISAAVTGKIDVRNWQAPTVAEAQTELSA